MFVNLTALLEVHPITPSRLCGGA